MSAEELGEIVAALRKELEWVQKTGAWVATDAASIPTPQVAAPASEPTPAAQPRTSEPTASRPQASEAKPSLSKPLEGPSAPQREPVPQPVSQAGPVSEAQDAADAVQTEGAPSDAEALAQATTLAQVQTVLGDCTRCKLSGMGRRNIVFGVGNPNADLMFVGEGPGQDEDRQGEPFVGKAGQLLTKIIESGMKLKREEVYIANIVKCRPPQNRDPEPDEVAACEPFLKAQIRAVKPKVIVALGRYAAQTLLRNTTPITRLRGTWMAYEGIDVMPTYHPAYLLRNPAEKRPVWADIQSVLERLKEGGAR